MEAIPVAQRMRQLPDSHFRLRILVSDTSHQPRTLLGPHDVHSSRGREKLHDARACDMRARGTDEVHQKLLAQTTHSIPALSLDR